MAWGHLFIRCFSAAAGQPLSRWSWRRSRSKPLSCLTPGFGRVRSAELVSRSCPVLRRYRVPIAISTDSNPGTSPATSLLLMMNMASTLFRMTVPEVLQGVTAHAALALGKSDRHGKLEAGRAADLAVWSVDSLAELAYWIGRPLCARVVRAGETVYTRRELN